MGHNTVIKQLKGYKMNVLKTLAIVTVSGIMATTAVVAEPKCDGHPSGKYHHGGKHHKMMQHRMKKALKVAGVTSEQKREIKEARQSMRATMKAKRAEMKASHNSGQFITVNGVNREAMIAKSVERATFRANLRADMMEKILSILTAEQKTKFVQALQEK